MNIYNTYASGILNHIFGTGILSKPATLAFGLTSIPPTNSQVTEVANAGGYARQALTFNSVAFSATNANWSFPTLLSGTVYNNLQITFPIVTSPLGMVSGAFIADNAGYGLGNILFYTSLTTPKDLQLNDQFYIPISGAAIRFS